MHNHQGEFRSRYIDNGVRKTAWQIVMERMDARYGFAEIDAGWSSDAYDDKTGTVVAGLINQFPTKVKMLHIKDVRNVAPATPPASGDPLDGTANASPVAFGTGEIDYRPIFAAAVNRVAYYHQEQDGGSLNDADDLADQPQGHGLQRQGHRLGPAARAVHLGRRRHRRGRTTSRPITVTNTGDAPLTISAAGLQTGGSASADEARRLRDRQQHVRRHGITVAPGATCIVNVGFKPTVTNKTSTARVRLTSTGDDAPEYFCVVGTSTGAALGGIGGSVRLRAGADAGYGPSFGSFVPATARTYDTAMSASVVSTAGDAILSVTDPSSTATGKLVNGEFSLAQPLQVRGNNAANTGTAFSPLSTTPGGAVALLLYTAPTAGADPVTIAFRQAIGANDVLRSGNYSKTLTFTVATTAP